MVSRSWVFTAWALGLLARAAGYETWHWVDLSAAICPKPPDAPQYSVGINYTADMLVDMPHIISFMRKSSKAMKVKFKVVDSEGTEVIESTEVTLNALDEAVPSTCECEAPAVLPDSVTSVYGGTYGGRCYDWDNAKCDDWWGYSVVGSWCCNSWCYASKDCPDAYESSLMPGVYFSYAACKGAGLGSHSGLTCGWTEVAKQLDPCSCKNMGEAFNDAMHAKFMSAYGSACSPWDMQNCARDYTPDQVDTWCCQDWCYVGKNCPSAVASLNPGMEDILFWSSNVCIDDPARVAQCPYKPEPNKSKITAGSCACSNATIPSERLPPGAPEDYGTICYPHDALDCDKYYPNAKTDMWCCMSWCWVEESCPGSQESVHWPGHFFSSTDCEMNVEAISSCPFNTTACECSGSPGSAILNAQGGSFSNDYGGSCGAWDADGCKSVWGSDADSDWNESSNHDWCCASWCYVSEDCPIAKRSWLGINYSFSYETCDDDNKTFNYTLDTCTEDRRLEASTIASPADDALEEKLEDSNGALARRLSGRRRGGGGGSRSRSSSSGSWGSPRRRSWSSTSTPRRRRTYTAPSSPRRRAPSPPPPPVRRRTPVPPTPITELRRRTTSMDGNSYSAARRRDPVGSTSPRRRSSYDGNYGYADRPSMMHNYNNQMPYQTPYGYSGYNAYPSHSNSNMALYAGGGGFIGGYATASYFNNDYGYHRYHGDYYGGYDRRRRLHNCLVPPNQNQYSWWDSPGDMIDCGTCRDRYGFCSSSSACYSDAGCGYRTEQTFNRDDLAATGFIPKDYMPPLSVIFEEISGDDVNPDPLQAGICPPFTDAEKEVWRLENRTQTIKLDLFLVLTRQEKLRTATSCEKDTGASCAQDTETCYVQGAICNLQHICECPVGYCLDSTRTKCQASSDVSAAMPRFQGLSLVALALGAVARRLQ